MKNIVRWLWRLPREILAGAVWAYQKILSPDHSFWAKTFFPEGYCPFEPSCSQYMRLSLKKYGVFKGLGKGTYRILRCHPWTHGGVDLP